MGAGKATVLLAEDHGEMRQWLCALLEGAGHAVVEACDGRAALDVAAAWPIDLLVADVSMPGLSGVDLARRLAVTLPSLPVLLISTSPLSEQDLTDAGVAARFLRKPFLPDQFTQAVRQSLNGHSGA